MLGVSSKQVVVISDRRDAHLPFVQRHLSEPLIVIDPLEIAAGKLLSFEYTEGGSKAIFDGMPLDPVGVWFRKPGVINAAKLDIDPRFQKYAASALQKHFSTLLSAFPGAYHMSDLHAITRASDKPLQIAVAKEIGLKVPDTLFTSDAKAAKAFVARYDYCIVKPVVPLIEETGSNQHKMLYSTKISSSTMPDLSSLSISPLIFQEAIEAVYDVRVTVVGDKVFAARIEHKGDDTDIRDWRLGHYEGELSIQPDENFSQETAQKCIEHAKRLGLTFSAIDFVVDNKGIYWFLENNPNGQWAFVEQETGQQIGKAIAELLISSR